MRSQLIHYYAPDRRPPRLFFPDLIRVVAMAMVILLHVVHYSFPLPIGSKDWWLMNFFRAAAAPANVLFFMMSGFFLLDPRKAEPLSAFFRRRFSRIIVPFLLWSVFYELWNKSFSGRVISVRLFLNILSRPSCPHLWFMYPLIALYFATPILRLWARNATAKDLLYFLGIWTASEVIFPLVERLTPFRFDLHLLMANSFLGYFVGGYAIRVLCPAPPKFRWSLLIVGFGTLTTLLCVYADARRGGNWEETFTNLNAPGVLLSALGVYWVCHRLAYYRPFVSILGGPSFVRWLARQSMNVYFSHVLLLWVYDHLGWPHRLHEWLVPPVFGIPMVSAAIAMLCAASASVSLALFDPVIQTYSRLWDRPRNLDTAD
jgi:surface polysaccharide O-acyltransferase-like enzyme